MNAVGAEIGPVQVTFFTDFAAATKREEPVRLPDLAERITKTTAAAKNALPWVKMARFGSKTTKKGSLRHDANLTAITGIEADYDNGAMPFAAAKAILEKAGLTALLYTSPSHTEDVPRWRVLCPLSRELPPDERDHQLDRLNGLFGGIFSRESWTLSQSYYYGSVNRNPSHQVELIEGTPIDLMGELDATAIGKPGPARATTNERPISDPGSYAPVSDVRWMRFREAVLATLSREAVDGEKHHALLRCAKMLGGVQVAAGFADEDLVRAMMGALPDGVADWNLAQRTAKDGLAHGRTKPIDHLPDRPLASSPRIARPPPADSEDDYGSTMDQTRPTTARRPAERYLTGEPPDWPTPLDFLADTVTDPPVLQQHHVPAVIWRFAHDTGLRMGVDPTSVALGCLVTSSSVITDDWVIQPKRNDYTWHECARLWGIIVGPPSILKSPVVSACTGPIDKLEVDARKQHKEDRRAYKTKHAAWKKAEDGSDEPRCPKLARYMAEGATIEALSEVLRDDEEATQYAPARKILSRQDEMGEFFGNLDRYAGKSGADRGAWLRAYNGGRYTYDRIGRGAFSMPNWSVCMFGGIQPSVIQKLAKESVEDGLLQRPMYCVPGPQAPGVDKAPDQAAINGYHDLIPMLLGMKPTILKDTGDPASVVLEETAHQHREDIDTIVRALEAMPDTSPQMLSALGKWRGLFARLCLTFHLVEIAEDKMVGVNPRYPNVIREQTAKRVADFMHDILLPHLLRADAAMFNTVQMAHAKWIAGYILSKRLNRITSRDVVRIYRPLKAPDAKDQLATVMAGLVTIGWLEPEIPSNTARPVGSWVVNPAVHLFVAKADQEIAQREATKAAIAASVEVVRRRREAKTAG